MIYLRSVLAGFGALLLAGVVVWIGFVLMFRVVLPRWANGAGGVGAVFGTGSLLTLLAIALAIFAMGFYWEFRRASGA